LSDTGPAEQKREAVSQFGGKKAESFGIGVIAEAVDRIPSPGTFKPDLRSIREKGLSLSAVNQCGQQN
jgi:hypothetical protein